MKPTTRQRLEHILESIGHIESFLGDELGNNFSIENEMQASAIFYKMMVIGEACRHIPGDFRKQFTDIPWVAMLGLRNVLAHEYFQLEERRIKQAVAKLPDLKIRLQHVIESLEA